MITNVDSWTQSILHALRRKGMNLNPQYVRDEIIHLTSGGKPTGAASQAIFQYLRRHRQV